MREIINKLFVEHDFKLSDISWGVFDTSTYINDCSETYILLYVKGLYDELYSDVVNLCSNEIFDSNQLTRAQKSNLYFIVISEVIKSFNTEEYNLIFRIEENNLYYKKFFFWYTESEVENLYKLLNSKFSIKEMNSVLIDYKEFEKAKTANEGYNLLSRLFVKFAFLTLADIDTLDKSLLDYIQISLNSLNDKLFDCIINRNGEDCSVDKILELVDLDKKDLLELEQLMKEVSIDEY